MTVLALDIGGTKTLAGLVEGGQVLAQAKVLTEATAGPEAWIDAAARVAAAWAGRYDRVAAAVTGLVDAGRWSALNPGTLPIPEAFPLIDHLERRFGVSAWAVNDAQAAAWGEHRFGVGQGADLVFLTISTGIGGGIVLGGRLLRGRGGLAGHLGVTGMLLNDDPAPVEDRMAGRWVAAQAARAGHATDAEGVFAAAGRCEEWAQAIVAEQARRMARLLRNVQLILAPDRIVLGGGIGLAPGHLGRVEALLADLPPPRRPRLVGATLGACAGLLGAADLAGQDAFPLDATNQDQQGRSA